MEEFGYGGDDVKGVCVIVLLLRGAARRRAGGTVQDQILHIKQEALGEGSPSNAPQNYPMEFSLRGFPS